MRWRRFFRRSQRDADSALDIQFYLDTEIEDNIARGMPPEEAQAAARRKFGNRGFIREEIYRMSSVMFVEAVRQDFSYALRTMRKSHAFAATAVLTLALGIGGNTAIFTVIRAVLLKPLHYRDPDRLVRVSLDISQRHQQAIAFSPVRFEEMRAAARSFTGLGAFMIGLENVSLSGGNTPEMLKGARVSANFLQILGLNPILGRSFLPEEDTPGGKSVALISTALWQSRFASNPQIAGTTAIIDSTPYTIIGVLPKGFEFPFADVDVWVTKPSEFSIIPPPFRGSAGILIGFARLKPQVTLEQARAEMDVLNHQYASSHPGARDSKATIRVVRFSDGLVANVRGLLWMLFGAVGFVLLIACANVASLLLSRASSRSREFAVRAALGAARNRLINQLLVESLLLAFAGGALGLLLAKWSLRAITQSNALHLPRTGEIRLDGVVFGFTAALSIATGVLFGLFPSLQASRPDLAGALRVSGERIAGASTKRSAIGLTPRGFLVVGQVALSIVLLIGAALLMESFAHLLSVDPGFQPANLLTMQIVLPQARYHTSQKKTAFFEELTRRVEVLPGVRGATVAQSLPTTPRTVSPIQIAELPRVKVSERPHGQLQRITPGYFRTLGIPLRRGREFTAHDRSGSFEARAGGGDGDRYPIIVMINESLARRFWPDYPRGQDPIGQHILIGQAQQGGLEIVGIAADVHEGGLASDAAPEVYIPCADDPPQSAYLAVRTEGDPLGFANTVRNQVLAIDRDQPVSDIRTMSGMLEASVGSHRLTLLLLEVFAGIALSLALIGLYGVIAYSVAQRTQELGIRLALGAQQSDVLWLVVGQGLGLTLVGVALGIGGAFGLTRVMKSLLFQVSATDAATFVGTALLFVVVALAASYIPARRATRIDPMAALR
jgi:predicted permease